MENGYNFQDRKKFVTTLPEKIQKRLQVLFALNREYEDIEKKYDEREVDIYMQFEKEMAPLYARRREILSGEVEPTEEEVKGGFPEDHEGKVNVSLDEEAKKEDAPVGIKDFWLTVLQNHVVVSPLIEEEDEPLLSHLVDINSCVTSGSIKNFKVTFTFSPNEYIKETELTLTFLSTEKGSKIEKSPITFLKPDFLYRKVPIQRKKGKAKGPTMKKVSRPSFFRMFTEDDDDEDDEDENGVHLDNEEVSSFLYLLHYKMIPSAINYFTGERDGLSDADEDDYDDDEEDEEDDDDDQEEEE